MLFRGSTIGPTSVVTVAALLELSPHMISGLGLLHDS